MTISEREADALPSWMQTDEMKQAMSTLKTFSDDDRAYRIYQARQNYLREQRSIRRHIVELQAEVEQERAEKEAALQREAAALAEIARLKAQLHDGR